MSGSARRIQKELAEISLDPPANCSAAPKGDDPYEWVSQVMDQLALLMKVECSF